MKLHTIVAASCCCAVLPAQGDSTPARNDTYSGLLQRAIARSQLELAREHDIWEDHSTWENAWRARTEHYEVRMMRSYAWAENIAEGLEIMMGEFQKTLGIDFAPAERMKVFVFPDLASYNAFGEQHGEHHSSFYGSFWASNHPEQPVAAVEDRDEIGMKMQITHGALHQYLARAFPGSPAPTFVHEGLAAYFAACWDYDRTLSHLEFIRGRHEYVPLDDLLEAPVSDYVNYTGQRFTELAMLFCYLLRFREDTRTTGPDEEVQQAPFRDYLLASLRGQDTSDMPVHQLLQDHERLGEEFAAYEFPR